jgi:signal peptidase I
LGFDNEPQVSETGGFRGRSRRNDKRKKNSWYPRLKGNVFAAFLIDLIVIVGAALILSLLVKTFLIRSFFVPSGSMLSTLQIQDRIIVNELVPNLVPIERGDVLVFKDPGGWLPSNGDNSATAQNPLAQAGEWFLSAFGLAAPDSSQHLVKRTIGLPGDRVVCCDAAGHLTINGVGITEVYLDKGVEPSNMKFDVVVPAHKLWMMGDNRSSSADSRFHSDLPSKGFVDQSFVVGRAFVISWPINHWRWLDNFNDVFKDVPQPAN